MPNFFNRIFRRKSSSSSLKTNKLSKKESKILKKANKNKPGKFPPTYSQASNLSQFPQNVQPHEFKGTHPHPDDVVRKPSFLISTAGGSTSELSKSYSGSSADQDVIINHSRSGGSGSGSSRKGSRSSGSGCFGGKSQRHSHSLEDADSDSRTNSTGPENDENAFVADFSGFNEDTENVTTQETNRLDYAQIQSLEKHNPIKPLYPQSAKRRQFTRLPDGQLVAMNSLAVGVNDGVNGGVPGGAPSPMSMSCSSDFSLSTDAEDNAYNALRRTATNNLAPMLEHSAVSSDDDESIGLNTIRKNDSIRKNTSYLSNSESDTEGPTANDHDHGNGAYFSDSDHEPESGKLIAIGNDTEDLEFTAGSAGVDRDDNNGVKNHTFQFEQKFDETLAASQVKKKMFRDNIQPPSSSVDLASSESGDKSLNTTLSPRTIAIQQAQNMRRQGKLASDLYPDSTDSELEDKSAQYQPPDLLPPRSKSTEDSHSTEGEKPKRRTNGVVIENFADFGNGNFVNSYELGSKSVADPTSPVSVLLKEAKDRRNRRKEASSVNSAPVTNMGYQSKRVRKPKNASSPARTRTDDASTSASSAAKEKLRRRRYEKEAYLKSLKTDSDEGSGGGGDANESWLIDEVTGALGPRGIAADLESLGERSGLSKASHRSGRSRRKPKRSDESVGSRHSRHSRSSRYSVKSSKSQASVVSEQSRSVANDLLRLEMQLARVGSKKAETDEKIETGAMIDTPGSRVNSARITQSRPKNTIAKRVKLTVVAPAGKLGIILANKTDGKGTVVSGVRTTSALADRVSPGDRIIEIDGEDVSRMTVSEITAIMTRKHDYERVLTVLTSARDSNFTTAPF